MIKVGINGFGSIGRRFFRQALKHPGIKVVGINDLGDPGVLAHLLRYDTTFGPMDADIKVDDSHLIVNNESIRFTQERDPANLAWDAVGADVIIESTGVFTDAKLAAKHLEAGAQKVIISAPATGEDVMIVLGVNEDQYQPDKHRIISNASCTTNCLAPVAKVLHQAFGIVNGLMTTVHAYTTDQQILDLPHRDWRRARAAAINIVPTTTGAARAVGKVLPELNGRLNGFALRVPVPWVSIVDLVAQLERPATVEAVNQAFREAAAGPMAGILAVCEEPLVSSDFKGNTHSAIVDALSTMMMGEHTVKVVAWYDNEWGYASRLVDLVNYIGERGL